MIKSDHLLQFLHNWGHTNSLGIENHSTTRIITQEFEAFLVEVILVEVILVEVFLINYGKLKYQEIATDKIMTMAEVKSYLF